MATPTARDTDPSLPAGRPHSVYAPQDCRRDRLFIFLPGTGEAPAGYRMLLEHAARLGFHTIGLAYPNATPLRDACDRTATQLDPDCHGKIRREIVTGVDDPMTTFQPAADDSILQRIDRLLAHLVATQPTQGWDAYYTSNTVRWSAVVLGGHSQGGGHAGFMASKMFAVSRAVFFSAPGDYWVPPETPSTATAAPWTEPPHDTGTGRYFGLVHTEEEAFLTVPLVWANFAMPDHGTLVSVDTNMPPYQQTHQLMTFARPRHRSG